MSEKKAEQAATPVIPEEVIDVIKSMTDQNRALQEQVRELVPKRRTKADETEAKGNKVKSYEMLKREEDHVHAEIWIKKFDENTGDPLFKPYVQKFNESEWYNFLKHPNGYSIKKILHLPDGIMDQEAWQKEQEKKEERKKRMRKAGQKV